MGRRRDRSPARVITVMWPFGDGQALLRANSAEHATKRERAATTTF